MQKEIIKKLSPGKKLELANQLYFHAWELKASAIRKFNPELTEKEVQEKVRKIFFYARS